MALMEKELLGSGLSESWNIDPSSCFAVHQAVRKAVAVGIICTRVMDEDLVYAAHVNRGI
ncbi:MAG: hypothetical protein MZV63_16975 [Marinilabiliales bacterium]|nr:hypothetical protein [Marinilabiliales bacterium]